MGDLEKSRDLKTVIIKTLDQVRMETNSVNVIRPCSSVVKNNIIAGRSTPRRSRLTHVRKIICYNCSKLRQIARECR